MKSRFSLFSVVFLSLAGCVSGGGHEFRSTSDPRLEIDQVPETTGAIPLTVGGDDVNANQGPSAQGGFAVTSLNGQVYLPKNALAHLSKRVPQAERALSAAPGHLPSLKTLAYNALAANNPDQALAYMSIAQERLGSLDDEALNIRGAAHLFAGRDDQAAVHFFEAAKRNSQNAIPNLNLGMLKQRRGNSLESLLFFKRAIAADPKSVLGYLHAANAAYTNKQYQTSAGFLRRAIDVAPANALAYYNLGVVYHYGLREHAKAKIQFKSVIDSKSVSDGLRDLARGMLANVQREET